jgi:hypothetical protein
MEQIRGQFDSITLSKIKKSLVITLVGIALTSGSMLGAGLLDWIAYGTPIDWRTPLIAALSACGAFVYNTLREWTTGE